MKIEWTETKDNIIVSDDSIEITAKGSTDMFIDPRGASNPMNVPWILFSPADKYILSVKVEVELNSKYDAGGVILYSDDTTWAKICLEISPMNEIISVSVVTQGGPSDDCVHEYLNNKVLYLRVSKIGKDSYAFHSSGDGTRWKFLRYFRLKGEHMRLGLLSQCPHGDTNKAVFTDINYREDSLKDMRNGK